MATQVLINPELRPFSVAFNVAVHTVVRKLFPEGFDVGPNAPSTAAELKAHIAKTGRMLVWDGASDRTIFADDETNYAFRAWHDWAHWKFNLPFTIEGERAAAEVQKEHIRTLYGNGKQARKFMRLIDAEVVGQAQYHDWFGVFPEDQRRFVKGYLEEGVTEV